MEQARILIVEDEQVVAADLEYTLQELGYTVVGLAVSGQEALHQADVLRPDVVLMDIKLKGALDGVAVAEQLRSCWQMPVIYLTAYADEATLQRAKVTEPFGYLLKPFEERQLHSTIEMVRYKHRMEQQLRAHERWLATTLQSIGEGVITTDAQGRVTLLNPEAEALTGWQQAEAVGKAVQEVFLTLNEHTRSVVENPVGKVLHEGKAVKLANHSLLVTADGREIPIEGTATAIRDEPGKLTGVVLVFRNITERKQAQAALHRAHAELELKVQERTAELTATNSTLQAEITERRRAEGALRAAKQQAEAADRVKSKFLATMSHELRTPLNIIMGYTDLLCDETLGILETEQVRVLRRVEKSARELFDLISALLDVNRLETGRLPVVTTAVPLPELLGEIEAEAQELLREKPTVRFEYMGAPGLSVLWTDRIKLKMVLKNLVHNAVKFTERGSITVHARARDGGVDFCVTDTGVGIAPEEQATIFEMFRQGDRTTAYPQGGVGLGLYIVRQMVELLGGTVTLESEKGRGSTFRVWVSESRSATNIVAVKRPGQSA